MHDILNEITEDQLNLPAFDDEYDYDDTNTSQCTKRLYYSSLDELGLPEGPLTADDIDELIGE